MGHIRVTRQSPFSMHASTTPGSSQLANKECMSLGCIAAIISIANGVVVHWLYNLSPILTNGMHQTMHTGSKECLLGSYIYSMIIKVITA